MRRFPVLFLLIALALTASACGGLGDGDDGSGGDDAAGLSVATLREGEDGDCPFTDDLRSAMSDAGMPNDIEPLRDNEVAYQDERDDDSADSTILGDTQGAHLLCKYVMGDDRVELDSYYLGDPEGRTDFTTAVAWQLVLGGVSERQVDEAQAEFGDQLDDAKPGFTIEVPDQFAAPGAAPEVMAIVRGSEGGSAAIALHVESDDPSVTAEAVEEAVTALSTELGD